MQLKATIYFTILSFLIVFPTIGQNPMGLYHMETIPQTSHLNPAMQPRAHGFVSLFSADQMFQNDLAFKDLFQNKGNEWVSPLSARFNYDKLYRTTGQTINLNENINLGLPGFGFRSGNSYFTFALSVKSVNQFGLPSDIFKVTENGFPDGATYNLSTMRVKQLNYKEISLGYSRQFNDALTLGINLKPLFGMAGAISNINTFRLNTSRHQYDLIVDGKIHVSAPMEIEEAEESGKFPEKIEFRDMEGSDIANYFSSFKNPGIAMDMGAVYKYNENWTFSGALNNLGFIKWNHDVNTLSFSGKYSFDGLNVTGENKDDLGDAMDDILDSIKTVINYDLSHGKFNTPLTPSIYLGTSYNLTHYFKLGLLSRSVFQKQNFRQDFNLSANLQPYSFVAFNLNYSMSTNGAGGPGTAITWLMGPLQLFFIADYLPTKYANVYMDDSDFVMLPNQKDLSFKFGLNLIFGRHGFRDKPMIKL